MSTIGPQAAKKIATKLKKKQIDFLDIPVTGSTHKAISGELTMFVGGDKKVYQHVKSILDTMGTNQHYMGETGSGQAIKMINNQILAATIEAVAEGMVLADAMGLSREKVVQVLSTVPAVSPMMSLKL